MATGKGGGSCVGFGALALLMALGCGGGDEADEGSGGAGTSGRASTGGAGVEEGGGGSGTSGGDTSGGAGTETGGGDTAGGGGTTTGGGGTTTGGAGGSEAGGDGGAEAEGGTSTGGGGVATGGGGATTGGGAELGGDGGADAGGAGGSAMGGSAAGGSATGGAEDGGGAGADAGGAAAGGGGGGAPSVTLPPANAGFDYQIGEAYAPPEGVAVVSRDRESEPAPGLYNICYVNGFQTQPGEESFWLDSNPDLVLREADGTPVLDEDWGEYLLDVGTEAKRAALAGIVGGWIERCAADGFDAVEIDNLDSFSRSGGLLAENDAVAFMALLSAVAHDAGLAIAQKNSAELLGRVTELGTDFAVAEECNRWSECGDYQEAYGDRVFVIEYRQQDFEAGCADFPELSIVLRDLDVTGPGSDTYVYDGC